MGAVFGRGHAAVADFEHVWIVPVSRARMGIQFGVRVNDVEHAITAAVPRAPFLLTGPAVLNVVRGAPEISPDFFAPEPRLRLSPLTDTQHDGATAGIQGLTNICVGGARILSRQSVAPVVFQIIDAP